MKYRNFSQPTSYLTSYNVDSGQDIPVQTRFKKLYLIVWLQGCFTSLLFLDFKKAFDCVDHSILLQKLQQYGITGQLHSLITSFITDLMQYVSVN